MEIEKKFTLKTLPMNLEQYEKQEIEQGYLCKNPIVRIRRLNESYILTYKSQMSPSEEENCKSKICREVELPLGKEGYEHLKKKADGNFITKTRYLIPLEHKLRAEVDIFHGYLQGLVFAEVEFSSEEEAKHFQPPDWFLEDVSLDDRYTNQYLSTVDSWKETL